MIEIAVLSFNDFQVNTYLIYDETKECVIIDPGCSTPEEEDKLDRTIASRGLKPVALLNTHLHIDHMFGNIHVIEKYNLKFNIHPTGIHFLNTAIGFASVFGYDLQKVAKHNGYMKEGDVISFGNSVLEVVETPGHSADSFCFICKEAKFVIAGDLLFNGSIGRTDLPSGNMDDLVKSVTQKIFPLGDDFIVYPGHGPKTTIGQERKYSPFFN